MLPWVLITGSFPPLVQVPRSGTYMLKHGSHVYVFSAQEIPAAREFLVPGTLSGRSIRQASLAQGGPESCNLGAGWGGGCWPHRVALAAQRPPAAEGAGL